jgi:hypothetical protein
MGWGLTDHLAEIRPIFIGTGCYFFCNIDVRYELLLIHLILREIHGRLPPL